MNLGDLIINVLLLLIPLFIIGLLILMFISMRRKKDQLNRLKNSSTDGVSKKQIK